MGESTIKAIEQLQSIRKDLHWFCPRDGQNDDGYFYPEDLQERLPDSQKERDLIAQRLDEVKQRKSIALEALRIYAFDGKDAFPYQEWLEKALGSQLKCEICVREYHRGRDDLRQSLLEERYDEDEVTRFLEVIDDMNKRRIKNGLTRAAKTLRDTPPEKRSVMVLEPQDLYAVFETLNSSVTASDDDFLSTYFDEPFRLAQERKRLRLGSYTPAMTYFLFQKNEDHRYWAFQSWAKFKRNITATEFDKSARPALLGAMLRVQLHDLDKSFLPLFWAGVHSIVDKLDADLVTHSLRAMDIDVCKLALDHLQIDSSSFRDLLATTSRIITISPADFWESMGTIPASTWIDQFFNSAALKRLLSPARIDRNDDPELLPALFSWILPFVSSIRAINQSSVCRNLSDQLFERFQSKDDHPQVKQYTYEIGLQLLSNTLQTLTLDANSSAAHSSASELLDLAEQHLARFVEIASDKGPLSESAKGVLRWSMALECKTVVHERELLVQGQELPRSAPYTVRESFWKVVARSLSHDNVELAKAALLATRDLIGTEKVVARKETGLNATTRLWNEGFDTLNVRVGEFLEHINEYSPEAIQMLFDDSEATNALISGLVSSDVGVQNATLEIIKTVSEKTVRQEALGDTVRTYFDEVLNALSLAFRRIAQRRTFAAAPNMLRISKDILELLCNPSDGALRSKQMGDKEKEAAETFWQAMWHEVFTIFHNTEDWSLAGREKSSMMAFVAETIDYANFAFDQIAVFTGSLCGVVEEQSEKQSTEKRLISEPKNGLDMMVKWLRLRDDSLLTKATELICSILERLKGLHTRASETALFAIEDVLIGKTKTVLPNNRKAQLHSALEIHLGTPLKSRDTEAESKNEMVKVRPAKGNQTIDMKSWASSAQGMPRRNEALEKVMKEASTGLDALSKHPEFKKKLQRPELPKNDSSSFKKQREAEMAAKKKRDLEAAAAAKRRAAGANSNAGSGVLGLGNIGKDHSRPKGAGIMISSDESSSEDDEDELDVDLFGPSRKPTKNQEGTKDYENDRAKALAKQKARGPVKKSRVARTAQDMRARLAPNLSPLHEALLKWEFFHDGPFPPKTAARDYAEVLSEFRDPASYKNTFLPLLTLEAWNGFLKSREELQARPYEIKVVNRSSVDAFVEVTSTASVADGKELSESDIILLSKASTPTSASEEPHCLARVSRINRRKAFAEVTYRIVPTSKLTPLLTPDATIYGVKIMSIVPLEREYGALQGLQYYDLCDEIVRARPSPLLKYGDEKLKSLIKNYGVNKAQARAIQSALDNDAFTLIQGPPGSGKTKTIVAIVGAILTDNLRHPAPPRPSAPAQSGIRPLAPKKLLVCAPSNAAVDELVMRFKDGVKMTNGEDRKLSVVRIGRSDAINVSVQDVTLDELINKRLNGDSDPKNASNDTQKIMKEHQGISERLRDARQQLDAAEAAKEGTDQLTKLRKEVDELRRSKALLSQKVDAAKDEERASSARADAARRKVQQEIIEGAHVICATLSGSGHDMFQNLNVEFETVIIDEAAQCVELSALIPLKYGCAKCVLVGDPQQLPPTVFSREAARFKYEQSLFVRMQANQPDDVHLLDTQYRMHPDISKFPSEAFYQSRLLDGSNMAALRTRAWHASELLNPFRFFDVQGQHESSVRGHSLINRAEIRVAMQLYHRLVTDFKSQDFKGKIGVITPYKSQLRELKDQFRNRFGPSVSDHIEFNTTDAFQGRESEIIIFSCVRASPSGGIGFLQDIRRMNVGLTRAKSSLWVLGNSSSLAKGEYWQKLIDYAKTSKFFTEGNLDSLLNKPSKMPRRFEVIQTTVEQSAAGQQIGRKPSNGSDVMDIDSPLTGSKSDDISAESNGRLPQSAMPPHADVGKERPANGTLKRKHAEEMLKAHHSAIKKSEEKQSSESDSDVSMKDVHETRSNGTSGTESVPSRPGSHRAQDSRPRPPAPRPQGGGGIFIQPKKKKRT